MSDNLRADSDGATTIYIQADSPGNGEESKGLRSPKGKFCVLLRTYQPKIEILNGQYKVAGIVKGK
jgi:hypothetical protein